jgi:hypothetical protein
MNAAVRIYHTQNAAAEIDNVLNVGGFNLDRALEVDPKFMEPEYTFEWAGIYSLNALGSQTRWSGWRTRLWRGVGGAYRMVGQRQLIATAAGRKLKIWTKEGELCPRVSRSSPHNRRPRMEDKC